MRTTTTLTPDLPAWAWLGLPLILFLFPYALNIDERLSALAQGEMGIVENVTVLTLLLGVVGGVVALSSRIPVPGTWLKGWILLLTLACFGFAGEELSWGQHFAGWSTPETWAHVNDQQETNLHNTSSLFDQVPRGLLTLEALVGGTIVPLLVMAGKIRLDPSRPFHWFWPTYTAIPVSVMALTVTLPKKAARLLDLTIPRGIEVVGGETKECLLAAFMSLYLWSLYVRLRNSRAVAASSPEDIAAVQRVKPRFRRSPVEPLDESIPGGADQTRIRRRVA